MAEWLVHVLPQCPVLGIEDGALHGAEVHEEPISTQHMASPGCRHRGRFSNSQGQNGRDRMEETEWGNRAAGGSQNPKLMGMALPESGEQKNAAGQYFGKVGSGSQSWCLHTMGGQPSTPKWSRNRPNHTLMSLPLVPVHTGMGLGMLLPWDCESVTPPCPMQSTADV